MWGLQRGTSVIPKSVTAKRVEANFDLDGWDLSGDEIKQLNSLPERFKVCDDEWLGEKVFFGDEE
jgi:glycerol 2-dehydrogenase (NADP+)